MAQKEKQENLW